MRLVLGGIESESNKKKNSVFIVFRSSKRGDEWVKGLLVTVVELLLPQIVKGLSVGVLVRSGDGVDARARQPSATPREAQPRGRPAPGAA